jgi:SAM-dependent methyltransferase
MGIDAHGLHCLEYASQFGAFGRTVTLGRQNVYLKASLLQKRFGADIDWKNEPYCERLLESGYGAAKVDSIDRSNYENASLILDMNSPLAPDIPQFDTVIDFGTSEHVFNISQALSNIIALCREGGQILHVSPANNFCGHGFWQFSPELFFSLYSEKNGFRDTEVFVASRKKTGTWYKVKKPKAGERVPLGSRDKLYVICRTVLAKKHTERALDVQQSDYVAAWEQKGAERQDSPQPDAFQQWLHKRILHKYFRTPSRLNPNLIRLRAPHRAQTGPR